jgi:hypothetical protein
LEEMSIPYEEAVNTLQSMFGGMDRDVICAVLHANRGHMERTIDQLLAMSGDGISNGNTNESNNVNVASPPPPSPNPSPVTRPPAHSQNLSQIQQDELLARMLQNELFMQEIRTNREFNGVFGGVNQPPQRYASPSIVSALEDDLSLKELKEKFGQLGEAAKLKFRELALRFGKKDAVQNVKYSPIKMENDNNIDDTEVVALDSTLARRTAKKGQEEDMDPPSPEEPRDSPLMDRRRALRRDDSKKDK